MMGGRNNHGQNPEDPANKSERKRQREKQRRSDLTSAFDALAAAVASVEPDGGGEALDPTGGGKKKRRKSNSQSDAGDSNDVGGTTRLDLIGKAVRIIRQLHQENEYRKHLLARAAGGGGVGTSSTDGSISVGQRIGDNNVLVMVPHLQPVDNRNSYPSQPMARRGDPHSSGPYNYQQQQPASVQEVQHVYQQHLLHQEQQQAHQQHLQEPLDYGNIFPPQLNHHHQYGIGLPPVPAGSNDFHSQPYRQQQNLSPLPQSSDAAQDKDREDPDQELSKPV